MTNIAQKGFLRSVDGVTAGTDSLDGTLGPLVVAESTATAAKTPVVATVTASGDTTIHTPASGYKIKLHWISAINDPDEASNPLIKVVLGSTEIYRVYALAHRETFTGPTDGTLKINLSGTASIAVTAHLEETL